MKFGSTLVSLFSFASRNKANLFPIKGHGVPESSLILLSQKLRNCIYKKMNSTPTIEFWVSLRAVFTLIITCFVITLLSMYISSSPKLPGAEGWGTQTGCATSWEIGSLPFPALPGAPVHIILFPPGTLTPGPLTTYFICRTNELTAFLTIVQCLLCTFIYI